MQAQLSARRCRLWHGVLVAVVVSSWLWWLPRVAALSLPTEPTLSLTDDTFTFWRGLKDAGLLDEVIQEFHQELMETMRGLQQRVQDPPLQLRGEELHLPSCRLLSPGVSAGGEATGPPAPGPSLLLGWRLNLGLGPSLC